MVRTIRRSYFGVFTLLAAMALLFVMAGSSGAAAGDTTRVSVDSSGAEGNNESSGASISSDGRYVAFSSLASNLVAGDTNDQFDVFVRDLQTGSTERVSVDSSGNQTSGASGPSMSADGRYVAFTSSASDVVEGDTNNTWDVFVHDRTTKTTERVSVDSSGTEANGDSWVDSMSADGRYIIFGSSASNLVEGDTNDTWDVFVRDQQTGTTERVNVNDSGEQANDVSFQGSMSADGRYVAFASFASNLVANDTNSSDDVFVRDLVDKTTERVSVASDGTEAYYGGYGPSISADGRYVVFTSSSKDLLPLGFWRESDEVFVHDRTARTTEWVSMDRGQGQPDGDSFGISISSDGRYVAFESDATDLVAGGDTNGVSDVFLRDRQTRTTELVSVNRCGTGANGESYAASMSADGRYVVFSSLASDLVDGDTNDTWDVFVRDRQTEPTESRDCIAPTTTHTVSPSPNANGWNNSDVTVTLDATDNDGGSGVKEISYSINGGANQTYNSTDKIIVSSEGVSTISYFATDNAGNEESPKTLTVKIDKSAPTVGSVFPDNGQKGVSRWINPQATFSEEMDPASLTDAAKLEQWNAKKKIWEAVPTAVSVEGKTARLDPYPTEPTRLLEANTKYQVTITTGAKNLAGIPLESSKSWTFTTGRR